MQWRIIRQESKGTQSGSWELTGVAKDTVAQKATFEQRPEGRERGSHGDPGGRQFQLEWSEQGGEEEMKSGLIGPRMGLGGNLPGFTGL